MRGHALPSRENQRPARIGAAALLAVGVLAAPGCVSSSRYAQVEQELAQLQANNAALTEQVGTLTSEKAALEATLAELRTSGDALGSKLHEREEEAKKLQATYDGLVTDLKKEVHAGQVQVQQVRDGLRVNVSQDILFDSGSAELDDNGTEVLGRVAGQLRKSPHEILVIGHTDNKPIGPALVKQYPTNWELAGARASSVVRLFNGSGVTAKRLLAVSMADVRPVASNASPEGRAKNRRIEIRLRPVPTDD
jgi:chemotaxis protein MotB